MLLHKRKHQLFLKAFLTKKTTRKRASSSRQSPACYKPSTGKLTKKTISQVMSDIVQQLKHMPETSQIDICNIILAYTNNNCSKLQQCTTG